MILPFIVSMFRERDGAGVVSIRPIGTGKTGLGIDVLLLVLGVVLVLFNSYPKNTFTQTRVHTLSTVACVSYVVFISDSYTFVLSALFLGLSLDISRGEHSTGVT